MLSSAYFSDRYEARGITAVAMGAIAVRPSLATEFASSTRASRMNHLHLPHIQK
jgi:hypothetical protein